MSLFYVQVPDVDLWSPEECDVLILPTCMEIQYSEYASDFKGIIKPQ